MEKPKGTRGSIWAGVGLQVLPLPIADMALRRLMMKLVADRPESFGRMAPYASVVFLIEPTDLPIQFRIQFDSPTPIVCQRRPAACAWDARIAGPISSLVAMANGALDGDALFFSRDITIEGNTDAILAMRNAVDAAEINLPYEIAGFLGPFRPAARLALQIALPFIGRVLNVKMASPGVHTA
jgi:predicted lipid carrier protein YhbT